jgi:hypothetical protein
MTAKARCAGLLLACALACALAAGCSSTTVGLQKDGTYILDNDELSLDCQRLSNSLWGRLQVLKSLPDRAKAEREAAAPTAVQAVGRWFGGSTRGLASLAEYDRERAHVRSLHRTLLGKGCPPLDIERELAATDAAISQYR